MRCWSELRCVQEVFWGGAERGRQRRQHGELFHAPFSIRSSCATTTSRCSLYYSLLHSGHNIFSPAQTLPYPTAVPFFFFFVLQLSFWSSPKTWPNWHWHDTILQTKQNKQTNDAADNKNTKRRITIEKVNWDLDDTFASLPFHPPTLPIFDWPRHSETNPQTGRPTRD